MALAERNALWFYYSTSEWHIFHANVLIDDSKSRPCFHLYSPSAVVPFLFSLPSPTLPQLHCPSFTPPSLFFSSVMWIICSQNPNITKLSIPGIHSAFILSSQRGIQLLSYHSNLQVSPYFIFPTSNLALIPLSQHWIQSLFHHSDMSLSSFTIITIFHSAHMALSHHSRNPYSSQHSIQPLIYHFNFMLSPYYITATLFQHKIPSFK